MRQLARAATSESSSSARALPAWLPRCDCVTPASPRRSTSPRRASAAACIPSAVIGTQASIPSGAARWSIRPTSTFTAWRIVFINGCSIRTPDARRERAIRAFSTALLHDGPGRPRLREDLSDSASAARPKSRRHDLRERNADRAPPRRDQHARLDRSLCARRSRVAAGPPHRGVVPQRIWPRDRRAQRAQSGRAARLAATLRPKPRDERARILRPAVHLGRRKPIAPRSDCGLASRRHR